MCYYSTFQGERRVEVNWLDTIVLTQEGEGWQLIGLILY